MKELDTFLLIPFMAVCGSLCLSYLLGAPRNPVTLLIQPVAAPLFAVSLLLTLSRLNRVILKNRELKKSRERQKAAEKLFSESLPRFSGHTKDIISMFFQREEPRLLPLADASVSLLSGMGVLEPCRNGKELQPSVTSDGYEYRFFQMAAFAKEWIRNNAPELTKPITVQPRHSGRRVLSQGVEL